MIAVVALASIAQAASFSWKLTTGNDYGGMNVYALTGITAAEVVAACASTDAAKWDALFSGYTPRVATTGNRGAAAGTATGIAAGDNLVWVIVDGAVAEGSKYWVANDYAIPAESIFEPPATGTAKSVTFANQGTAGSGTFTAVPEPTSGLLMLLGMAGFALRRRRA